MFYKIMKFSKIRALSILLIILMMLFAGCASSTAVKQTDQEVGESLNLITDISTAEDSESISISIKSKRLLTYTSVKQPMPLSVVLYFPETALGEIKTSLALDNAIVSSIKSSELTEDGHTSRIEIALKKDASYKVTREGEGLKILFAKETAIPTPDETETIKDVTITDEPDIKPDEESMPVATRLQSVFATKLETGVKIHLEADGKINNYKSFTIASPARIVFDLYNIESPYRKEQLVPVDTKWVKRIRYYAYPDRLRVVLDTDKSYLSRYSASNVEDGLLIHVGSDVIISKKEVNESGEDKQTKPAWVNRVDFSSEDAGKSTIIIGTTRPVKYKMDKAADKRLQLTLFNTNLSDYRKRPLITTRFNSAVDRITPMQTPALKTSSMIVIDLRESVPCYIEQAKDLLLVHFDASSIPPKPVEQADLPSWKKAIAQTAVEAKEIEDKKAGYKALRPKVARKYTGEKIALDFYDTDIQNVFRILMEVSGKNFAIDKDVTGKITLTLAKPVPWDQALDLILKMNQLGKTSERDIIRIATLETLKKEEDFKQAEIIAIQKAREEQKILEPFVTEYIAVNYSNAIEDILPHLEKILTKDRGSAVAGEDNKATETAFNRASVTADQRTNMIIMTDVPDKIKKAKEIIKKLDKVTPQVIIEARIVEASTNFSREIGVEWSAAGGIQQDDPNAGIGPQRGYDELGGTYGYDMAMNFPIAAVNPASIGFNFLRIAGSPLLLNAKLLAMESEGEGKIISAPKVVTLDNKTAIIQRGEKIPYPRRDKEGNIDVEFAEATLKLEVTPHITDDKRINLIIDVQKDEPDWSKTVQEVPAIRTKNAHTELLVNDGDTVVIGGIMTTTKSSVEKGVPWLSKIPLLGWLFKSQTKTDKKEELLIFITPQIVQLEQRGVIDD